MAYLESKPRYETLDGLRGVAALMVVAFHLFETYSGGTTHQIINHGYLAVDFFFLLSGFVLGYAYDDRLSASRLSLVDFFKRRIVRLHPMIILGGLIGLLLFYHYDTSFFPLVKTTPWWQVVLIYVTTVLMIPTPWMDHRGWEENFPINSPQWSLLLEYIANVVYAFVLCRVSKRVLWALTLVSAFFVIDLGAGLNVLGDKPEGYWSAGTVTGGWLFTGWEGHIAWVRVSFPILCGLLLSRYRRFVRVKGGFWWCSLLVVATLSMPRIGGDDPAHYWQNGLYESLCIVAVFPFVIAMGAGSGLSGARSQRLCKWLADISYPLYITHIFARYLQMAWKEGHEDLPLTTHIMVSVSLFVVALLVAQAALKLYDEPVREWLKQKWLKR
ncbi:MAG: acyltransferase [Bacteroidaceae bacterium]|nr:acyltransferase [Bacteroidaceae bacterium]